MASAAAPLCWAPQLPSTTRISGVKLHFRSSLFANNNKLNTNFRRRQCYYYSSLIKAKAVPEDSAAVAGKEQQVQPSRVVAPDSPIPPVRGANLGGWLLVEGWIAPDLFKDVKNVDMLDGNSVTFQSVKEKKSLVAEDDERAAIIGKGEVNANQDRDTFVLWRVTDTRFQFRVCDKMATDNPNLPPVMPGLREDSKFIGLDDNGQGGLVVAAATPTDNETFEIIRNPNNSNLVHIRSLKNGNFIQVKSDGSVTADIQQCSWKDDDPAVFLMSIGWSKMDGEFQLINALGKENAQKVLNKHWDNFIKEEDFGFMAKHKINAVRIPVGYWIASDQNPPFPFLSGSLAALDKAFDWGMKHHVRIIVDLHAIPGAANARSHGGSRDGCLTWGLTDKSIDDSVEVISFLAQRYKEKENFLAIQLINEPVAPQIAIDRLKKYYEDAYAAIRKHSNCYVIISSRFLADPKEFLDFAKDHSRNRIVLDIHNYQTMFAEFQGRTPQEIIDYVKNERAQEMQPINPPNGLPLLYIGEWTGRWDVTDATEKEFREYMDTQLEVFGSATFGWTFWTFKLNDQNQSSIEYKNGQWSMKWLIDNGYYPKKYMLGNSKS